MSAATQATPRHSLPWADLSPYGSLHRPCSESPHTSAARSQNTLEQQQSKVPVPGPGPALFTLDFCLAAGTNSDVNFP